MKELALTIRANQLKSLIGKLSPVTNSKTLSDSAFILFNVVKGTLFASSESISIQVYDRNLISSDVSDIEFLEETDGLFAINAGAIRTALSTLKDDIILELILNEKEEAVELIINSGKTHIRLALIASNILKRLYKRYEDIWNQIEVEKEFALPLTNIQDALNYSYQFVNRDTLFGYSGAVLLSKDLEAVSTDGIRLAVYKVDNKDTLSKSIIIPQTLIPAISLMNGESIYIGNTETLLTFRSYFREKENLIHEEIIIGKKLIKEFPNYLEAIIKGSNIVKVDSEEFYMMIRRAASILDKLGKLELTFEKDKIGAKAALSDVSLNDEIKCNSILDEPRKILFDVEKIADFASYVAKKGTILEIEFQDIHKPILFRCENKLFVVASMV